MISYCAPFLYRFASRPSGGELPDSRENRHIEIVQETLNYLQEQFQYCSDFIPISVIGDNVNLKTSILSEFASLESVEKPSFQTGEDTLLSVYPRPVQVGSHQLLLFEMLETDFLDENKLKTLHAVLSVTSVCIVCVTSAQLFPSLNKIYELLGKMWPKCGFKLSKFFVFVETLSQALQGRKYVEQALLGDCYDFSYVGKSVISKSSFTYMLGKISEHTYSGDYNLADSQFHRNLAAYYNATPPIYSLLRLIETLIEFGNLNLTLEQYLDQLPDFNKRDWLNDQKQVECQVVESQVPQVEIQVPQVESQVPQVERHVERQTPQVEKQVPHEDPVIQVVPLIPMSLGDSNRTDISSDALTMLREQFAMCQDLIPIAVIGDFRCGKNAILDEFAALGGVSKAFSSFGQDYGVAVLRKPVPIGKYKYLLMKMSVNFRDEDEKKMVLFKKVVHAILSISAVCILCFEKNDVFSKVNEIMELYHGLRDLKVSKFFICLESESELDNPGYRHLMESRDNWICEFFYRGRLGISKECISSMLTIMNQDYFHYGYEATHWLCQYQEFSKIDLMTSYLEVLLYLANLNLTVEDHILKAPVYYLPSWWDQIAPIEQHLQTIDEITQAEVVPLFRRTEDSVEYDLQVEIQVPQVEIQVPQVDLVITVVPLITMSFGESNRADISSEVLTVLRKQFAIYQDLIPIAVIGDFSCGKNSILDEFAALGGASKAFSSFGQHYGVTVLPKPVPIGKYQFLIMKMSVNFRDEDEQKRVLFKKVAHAILSISAVCILCFEKNDVFSKVNEVMRLYHENHELRYLEVSKFFICLESESELNNPGYRDLMESRDRRICECFYRGRPGISKECISSMLTMLTQDNFHSGYEATHWPLEYQQYSKIDLLTNYLEVLLYFANLDLTLQDHILKAPVYSLPCWWDQIVPVVRHFQVIDEISQVKTLPLFRKTEDSIEPELDLQSIEEIMKYFNMKEPTVILSVIGWPGLGKSTLLNAIIQAIIQTQKPFEVFKVGNSAGHTTRDSHVLSRPLRLPSSKHQLMLLDLEGVQGTEIRNEEEALIQLNLTSDILAISSVYCILVKNEVKNIEFVKETIRQISVFRTIFGYKVQRIYLLFHDKDGGTAEINPDLTNDVASFNQIYFYGSDVIRIELKPNFAEGIGEKQQTFLTKLLDDVDYPKQKLNGNYFNVFSLFEKRLEDSVEDVSTYSCMSKTYKKEADDIIKMKLEEMDHNMEFGESQLTSVLSMRNWSIISMAENELRKEEKPEKLMQYVLKSLISNQGSDAVRLRRQNRQIMDCLTF